MQTQALMVTLSYYILKKLFCMGGLFDGYQDTDMAVNDVSE